MICLITTSLPLREKERITFLPLAQIPRMNDFICFEGDMWPLTVLLVAVDHSWTNESSMDYDELLMYVSTWRCFEQSWSTETIPTRHSALMQATPSDWPLVWSDRNDAELVCLYPVQISRVPSTGPKIRPNTWWRFPLARRPRSALLSSIRAVTWCGCNVNAEAIARCRQIQCSTLPPRPHI